jgi:hypothetical protein
LARCFSGNAAAFGKIFSAKAIFLKVARKKRRCFSGIAEGLPERTGFRTANAVARDVGGRKISAGKDRCESGRERSI